MDAARLARDWVLRGGRELVVLGGDGTVGEVVGGCVADTGDRMLAEGIVLSVVHQGTGGDLVRGIGVPRAAGEAVAVAASGSPRHVDVGVASYTDLAGAQAVRGWVSCCNVGMGADVVARTSGNYRRLGATAGFAASTVATLLRNRPRQVRIGLGGAPPLELGVTDVIAANNRYMGGGMLVAPSASIDDGELDVVVVAGASRTRLLRAFPRIYRGTHVDHPLVRVHRTRELSIEPHGAPEGVVLDGELVGHTPARFWLLPRSIAFRVGAGL
jgi:diacylglycerol kinase (ATP)